MENIKYGVIYVSIGKNYNKEVSLSVESLRRFAPTLPVTIFTDQPDLKRDEYTKIIIVSENESPKILRIKCLSESNYENVLYLDSDTYIVDDFLDIFKLLDYNDLLISRYTEKITTKYPAKYEVPIMNCGVILYRNTGSMKKFFKSWMKNYILHLDIEKKDEPSFYYTLIEEMINFGNLSEKYNYRTQKVLGHDPEAAILHGHFIDIDSSHV